jgi:predicted RNase H-like HicB family nuclease
MYILQDMSVPGVVLNSKEDDMPTMTIKLTLPIAIQREDDVFVSVCSVFDVASQGCTADEAKSNLIEALHLFIQTCIEMGTISQVMQDSGFVPACSIQEDESNTDQIDIVLPYIAAQKLPECHV